MMIAWLGVDSKYRKVLAAGNSGRLIGNAPRGPCYLSSMPLVIARFYAHTVLRISSDSTVSILHIYISYNETTEHDPRTQLTSVYQSVPLDMGKL